MFYIFPNINYKIKLSGKEELLLEKAGDSVIIVKKLSFAKTNSHKDFEGVVHDKGFSLRRILRCGYSAFLPILTCKIYDDENAKYMKINIGFYKCVSIGLSIFFLFQIIFFTLDFTSIALIVVPYLVIIYLFNVEVKFLKEEFNRIVDSARPASGNKK